MCPGGWESSPTNSSPKPPSLLSPLQVPQWVFSKGMSAELGPQASICKAYGPHPSLGWSYSPWGASEASQDVLPEHLPVQLNSYYALAGLLTWPEQSPGVNPTLPTSLSWHCLPFLECPLPPPSFMSLSPLRSSSRVSYSSGAFSPLPPQGHFSDLVNNKTHITHSLYWIWLGIRWLSSPFGLCCATSRCS